MVEIKPQPGPQEKFLSSSADIAIYGGAAGGGKTYALLLENLRHIRNKKFGSVFFRRSMPMITAEGGAWDVANELYRQLNAHMRQAPQLEAEFPGGAKVGFHHLQYEATVHDYQSAQMALIEFDELTQFTEHQFFYMLSRNRSTSGIRGYVRCGTNPNPDSWVRRFIDWWIDPKTGYAIPERSGVVRFFIRVEGELVWGDTPEQLVEFHGIAGGYAEDPEPMSLTFIASDIYDNKILLDKDPSYLSKLKNLPRLEKEQLLKGNWNARATPGMLFARTDFKIVEIAPIACVSKIRYWDRASTEASEQNKNPDWTAGVKISKGLDGLFYIEHTERFRARPLGVKKGIKAIAVQDKVECSIGIEQDPGQAGVAEAEDIVRFLAGFDARTFPVSQKKFLRWKPLSAQLQAGNVVLVRGDWNEAFISELIALTDKESDYDHDDQADAAAGAFNALVGNNTSGFAEAFDVS
jgi:predicted phage terminase large subunit-like protein